MFAGPAKHAGAVVRQLENKALVIIGRLRYIEPGKDCSRHHAAFCSQLLESAPIPIESGFQSFIIRKGALMNREYGEKQVIITEAGEGRIWAEINMELPDLRMTLSARLPKKNYTLSELRDAVFAELDRTRELVERKGNPGA